MALAAHTIVKQIIDFAMAIFGTFSTVSQTLVASSLGKARSHGSLFFDRPTALGKVAGLCCWHSVMQDLSRGRAFSPCAPTVGSPQRMVGQR